MGDAAEAINASEQLQGALNSRVVIEQAEGAVAQVHQVSVDAAFTMIRSYARRTNRRLVDVAAMLVTDLDGVPNFAGPAPEVTQP